MADCEVLIIDDDIDDVFILTEALTSCGVAYIHHVDSAMKAFVYLDGLSEGSLPKLIVTDHHLPCITGSDFLMDLKGMEKYNRIPVIVLSAHKSPQERERYGTLGALDYMDKPASYQESIVVAGALKQSLDAAA